MAGTTHGALKMMLIKYGEDDTRRVRLSNKVIRISLSLMMLQMSLAPVSFAQGSNNTTGLPNSDNPDAWPWMQTTPSASKHKDGSSDASAAASTAVPSGAASSSAPVPEAVTGAAAPEKATEKAVAAPKMEYPKDAKHELEFPKDTKHEELRREPTAALQPEHAAAGAQPRTQSRQLFGRIEQLTSGVGAKFPVLKAQTAKMDLSGQTTLKAGATDNMFSGEIVRSFPAALSGTWGGVLRISQVQLDPLYYQQDAEEAKQTADLFKPGTDGKVNLVFQNSGAGLSLEPAQLFFTAPMTESRLARQMSAAGGMPGMGGMGAAMGGGGMQQMMKSMMMSMPYIYSLALGAVQGTGITGGSVQTTLLKNDVRQLSPTVIEEQILGREIDTNPKTGQQKTRLSESVVRLTRYNDRQEYVQAVAVDYTADKRFLRKMVFAGYVTHGVSEQMPNPMGSMGSMGGMGGLPGMGGAGGMDMQQLQKLIPGFGSGMGGSGMPTGGEVNPFKGLFGQ